MNRLAKETSPYLKQHQENPVDWYPWGEEALRLSRETNRPILLSVGYAACHWCHVMAHETFDNPALAQLMNERFVNIKVDREERPELDKIYQPVAQALTGGGGWPLTVFLTPDQKPFYGGTYFPPEDRYGRPGFGRVLEAVSDAYRNDPLGVSDNASRLTAAIIAAERATEQAAAGEITDTDETLMKSAEAVFNYTDPVNGGLGGAPKFPNVPVLSFLWRAGLARNSKDWKEAILLSLRRMASGGIYDQLAGGFHRYAVDEAWSVPHFEKMLYDNGLLLRFYSEVLLSAGAEMSSYDRDLFLRVIEETAQYLLQGMQSPEGLFYSSQDADTEGVEGKFYVWDLEDLVSAGKLVLTGTEAEIFKRRYGISEAGNFEDGKTVLHLSEDLEDIAEALGLSISDAQHQLEAACEKLRTFRSRRVAPARDEKVLTSWNALAISGLAWTSGALLKAGKPEASSSIFQAARRAFEALISRVRRDSNRIAGTVQDGKAKTTGTLDDYAYLMTAALDLARWCPESEVSKYLGFSREWLQVVFDSFEADAGFFFTSQDHEPLLFRPRALHDSATPAGTPVVLAAAMALAEIDSDPELLKKAEGHIFALRRFALQNPSGGAETLSSILLWSLGPVVVSGAGSQAACRHAHVFRKPSVPSVAGVMICHKQTCGAPRADGESVWREIAGIFRISPD